MYSDSNYHNSSYYRYYYHLLWIFDIFLDVSDWKVRQLAYSNLPLAVQLEIQTLKDENGKFMKQNKCKIRKFYFQLLTPKKKTEFLNTINAFLYAESGATPLVGIWWQENRNKLVEWKVLVDSVGTKGAEMEDKFFFKCFTAFWTS